MEIVLLIVNIILGFVVLLYTLSFLARERFRSKFIIIIVLMMNAIGAIVVYGITKSISASLICLYIGITILFLLSTFFFRKREDSDTTEHNDNLV